MRLDTKCLTETTAIVIVSLLFTAKLSQCKQLEHVNKLQTPSDEGILSLNSDRINAEKRDIDRLDNDIDELEKRAWNNNFASWGKRKWGEFTSWGKRNPQAEYEVAAADGLHPIEKRGWFKFNSWGKRSDPNMEDDKRKWSNLAVWGKRNGGNSFILPEKRKWQSFASWGKRFDNDEQELDSVQDSNEFKTDKRKWSSFASWGKRDPELTELEKRKWASFASWGKRDDQELLAPEKRKWSSFTSWGKRDDPELTDAEKRKWSSFTSWGKRDNDFDPVQKRWSQFSSWGKRRPYPSDWAKRRWAQFNSWGKRRWHGLATWGKRADQSPERDSVAEAIVVKLLQFFDTNGKHLITNAHTCDMQSTYVWFFLFETVLVYLLLVLSKTYTVGITIYASKQKIGKLFTPVFPIFYINTWTR